MTEEFNNKNLDTIANILIPDSEDGWPSASIVYDDFNHIIESMNEAEKIRIYTLEAKLHAASDSERTAVMQAFEADDGELFGRIYRWLLNAYYSSPEVVAKAETMANAAPREACVHFDARLVAKVIETRAGQYRASA